MKKIQAVALSAVLAVGMVNPVMAAGNKTEPQADQTAVVKDSGTQDMYRLYNRNSGEHFYTANSGERNSLVKAGWRYEGIGWTAPKTGDPVYRLYNPNAGEHHYTTKNGEKNSLVRAGWKYEGIGWRSGGSVPLYRQYNPHAKTGTHNYTTSKAENDSLVKAGWKAEGIGWYGTDKKQNTTGTTTKPSNNTKTSNTNKQSHQGAYKIGETWTVPGQWKLTVNSVKETSERNQFSDKHPAAVYIVTYTYENIGFKDSTGLMDGLYLNLDDTIVDSTGKMGYTYPDNVDNPKEVPVGAHCTAQVAIGVDHPGNFTLGISTYDGNEKKQAASFYVDLNAAAVEPIHSSSGTVGNYSIGQTWSVPGQWNLTVNSVKETSERNQFSDKHPAAVYIVTYTYENVGFQDSTGLMDGLYLTLDDTIVDSAGKMGYTYPDDVENPKEVPVGAHCTAQVAIGVDHPGNFTLGISTYDGNEKKQTASFYIAM